MANAQFKSSSAPAPDGAALGAADVCRYVGRMNDAIQLYEKVVGATRGGRGLKRNQDRARDAGEALNAFKGFDLARANDGTFTGTGAGFRGPITVQVVVKSGRIESIKVTGHREDWFAAALTDVPRQIVERQSLEGVDAVSGATWSSEGVYNGAARALGQAMK